MSIQNIDARALRSGKKRARLSEQATRVRTVAGLNIAPHGLLEGFLLQLRPTAASEVAANLPSDAARPIRFSTTDCRLE